MEYTKTSSVTEYERNEVFLVLTYKEFVEFRFSLNNLMREYKRTGTLDIKSFVPILGNLPKCYQSTSIDAMLEAYDERAEYGKKARSIENFIRYEVEMGH